VKEKSFRSPDFEDLKREVEEFTGKHVQVKSNVLERDYFHIERLGKFGCSLKWWDLPAGRENCRGHSTGLSSDSPDGIRKKVDGFLKRKVSPEDLIGVDYYTFGRSFTRNCH
jgi:hypothetical protein